MCVLLQKVNQELVSIIVPVYNVERYLPACLDSLIHQTYANLEIILVDDGSSDKSGGICEQYALNDSRVRVIRQPNLGPSAARNRALDDCHGNWVVFCDSDDYLDCRTVETSLQYAIEYDVDIVRYGYVKHYRDGRKEVISVNSLIVSSDMSDILLTMERTQYFSFACMCLIKRSVIGGTRFDKDLRYCEDHLFTLTCYKNTKRIVFIPESYYHYNIHDSGSLSTPKDYLGIIKQANKELEVKCSLINPTDDAYNNIWSIYCGKINLAVSIFFIVNRTYSGAKSFFNESYSIIKSNPICSHSNRSKMFYFSKLPFFVRFFVLIFVISKGSVIMRN